MTAKNINDIVQLTISGKVLASIDWYANEKFFTEEVPQVGWKLISKEVIKDSKSKNYIDQTAILRDSLQEVGALTDEELEECTDKKLKEINNLMKEDWKKAAEVVCNLKVNQRHRRSMVEAMYDIVLRFKATGERSLENTWDWTNSLSSGGDLVHFGYADSRGAGVGRGGPGVSDSFLGVVSSR